MGLHVHRRNAMVLREQDKSLDGIVASKAVGGHLVVRIHVDGDVGGRGINDVTRVEEGKGAVSEATEWKGKAYETCTGQTT
jgi:hypothetical protein